MGQKERSKVQAEPMFEHRKVHSASFADTDSQHLEIE
jgi:hypothetical protein